MFMSLNRLLQKLASDSVIIFVLLVLVIGPSWTLVIGNTVASAV